MLNDLFIASWSKFCTDFAGYLGIHDVRRMEGLGAQNMALLLSKNVVVPAKVGPQRSQPI